MPPPEVLNVTLSILTKLGAANTHPALLAPFVDVAAIHPAPPVAVLRLIDIYCVLATPLLIDSVWLAVVAEVIVTKLPAFPDKLKYLKVVVVAAVNVTAAGCVVFVISL